MHPFQPNKIIAGEHRFVDDGFLQIGSRNGRDADQMTSERYTPSIPFPPYAFVPGRNPHPVTDPRGHSYQRPEHVPDPLDPRTPFASDSFQHAVDLFNAGYYWEAHEAWEQLWIAAGRTGIVADFLKGLIKLAAAGVKAREGRSVGVQRHAKRAAELLESVRGRQSEDHAVFAAIELQSLFGEIESLVKEPKTDTTQTVEGNPVLGIQLKLSRNDASD